MKPESRDVIKEALNEKGELPLTWECGCDSSILNFDGWSNSWAHLSSALQEGLHELRDHIVDELELPGVGPVIDEGEGCVFLDEDGAVMLVYSSRFVSYEFPDSDLAEVLREQNKFELEVDGLNQQDFSFNLSVDEDTQDKNPLANFSTKPELDVSAKSLFLESLRDHIPDFETKYWMTNKKSDDDFVKCRSLEMFGNWTSADKKLVFDKWCGVECLEHDLKEQKVKLF